MENVLLRKFNSFRRNPKRSVLYNLHRGLMLIAKQRMQRAGLVGLFAQRPASAFAPDYADLWFLYETVRQRKPQTVLEIGSGCSTIIIAKALADNATGGTAPGHLYSVDASAHWSEVARKSTPQSLHGFVDFIYSPVEAGEFEGKRVAHHATLPEVTPEMIYLDGGLTEDIRVNADVALIHNRLPAGAVIVVDGRDDNVAFLRQKLPSSCYRYKAHPVSRRHVFEKLASN